MSRHLLLVLLCLSALYGQAQVIPSFGNSRTGSTGMQFLKIPVDARSTGMAGTTLALVNDVSAMYWNPAGITRVDSNRVNIMLCHSRYFADVKMSYAGAVIKAGKQGFMGVQVQSMDYGELEETTEFQPFGTGRKFRVNNYLLGVSYARVLTESFSLGLSGKYAQEGIAGVNTNNVLFDLGFQYNVGIKNTRFAVSMSNFGFNVKPEGEVQLLDFTAPKTEKDFERVSVPAIFRLGVCSDLLNRAEHRIIICTQLNHPTDNNESVGFGAEYCYRKVLLLRSGYEFGQDVKSSPSVGAGIKLRRRFGNLLFDYSFNHRNTWGNQHRFTLGVGLK